MTSLEISRKNDSIIGVVHTTRGMSDGYLGVVTIIDDSGKEYIVLPGSNANRLRAYAYDKVIVEGMINYGKQPLPTIKVSSFWLIDEVHPAYYRFNEKLKPVEPYGEDETCGYGENELNSSLDQSYEDIVDNWVSDNISFDIDEWLTRKKLNSSAKPKRAS